MAMRVSTNQTHIDTSFFLRQRQEQLNLQSNRIANQSRIKDLRDDPLGAARATRFQSQVVRLDRFSKNIDVMRGRLAMAEGNLSEAVSILQRVRELAVQGANGVLSKDQTALLGEEVNQLLGELASLANSRGEDGKALFAGFNNSFEPFRVETGRLGDGREGIRTVQYVGDIGRNAAEVSEGNLVDFTVPGNYAFWAENQQVFATVEATGYRAPADATFRLDGTAIEVKQGDNVFAIIDKINDSSAPVRARLDPIRDSMVLETTFPHQLWLEDAGDGAVLQDLGMINAGSRAPHNVADSARSFGGSMFDMVIHVRDRLFEGDTVQVGGSGIRGIDDALNTVVTTLTDIGAVNERVDLTQQRLAFERPERIRRNDAEVGIDLATAITDLRALEAAHQAALAVTARSLGPRLMDFLR